MIYFQKKLFQFHRPVSMVEELFPASITLMAEMDVDERIVQRLNRLLYQCHACLFELEVAFFNVTGRTRADYIFPCRFASKAPGDNMVD